MRLQLAVDTDCTILRQNVVSNSCINIDFFPLDFTYIAK